MANISNIASKIDSLYKKLVIKENIVARVVDIDRHIITGSEYIRCAGLGNTENTLLVTIKV